MNALDINENQCEEIGELQNKNKKLEDKLEQAEDKLEVMKDYVVGLQNWMKTEGAGNAGGIHPEIPS